MMIENIGTMLAEIKRMQTYCAQPENYERGYDVMCECWSDEDYENLFFDTDPAAEADTPNPIRRLTPFTRAWERLHNVASIYDERQSDAAFHAAQ